MLADLGGWGPRGGFGDGGIGFVAMGGEPEQAAVAVVGAPGGEDESAAPGLVITVIATWPAWWRASRACRVRTGSTSMVVTFSSPRRAAL